MNTFENLNSYDLERLCRDLLNEDHRINIRSNNGLNDNSILSFSNFKQGKDKGIDLHYEDANKTVIGQVKHSSGKFQELFAQLKRKVAGYNEADKVLALNPAKYIFMTSVPLSLENKKSLMKFFSPYIKQPSDIYGREDLDRLLIQFPNVLRSYPKLYFSSTLVLERIQNLATLGRSKSTLGEIFKDRDNFVRTSSFAKALSILDQKKLLIIKGLPGVGKTTMAKMLSLYFVEQGFEFIEILNLDSEIERLIETPGKNVYYYDDFLGSNEYVFKDALTNEARLSNLIRKIAKKTDKALILTTRTNILNKMGIHSHKLSELFNSLEKFAVDITQLSYEEKKEIILKHISKNSLNSDLFTDNLIDKVALHTSFSPRLVEFFTKLGNVESHLYNYDEFVMQSLENPTEIWLDAYRNQSELIDRIYLNHLFLFGNSCKESIFRLSFENRLMYEIKNNNRTFSDTAFRDTTTLLDEMFITVGDNSWGNKQISFTNPSIIDFLLREIKKERLIIKNSIRSYDRIELLMERFNHSEKDLHKIFDEEELVDILLQKDGFKYCNNADEKLLFLALLSQYFSIDNIEMYYRIQIEQFLNDDLVGFEAGDFLNFLEDYKTSKLIRNFVTENFTATINLLLSGTEYEDTFDSILRIFEMYDIDYEEHIKNDENRRLLYSAFEKVLEDSVDHFIFVKQDSIVSMEDVEKLYSDANIEFRPFFSKIDRAKEILVRLLDAQDWESKIKYNKFQSSGIE